MRYWGAVLATALVALPLVAAAQPISGLYVGGGVGADIPQDTRVTPGAPSIGGAGHLRLNQEDVGLTGIGAVGYGLGNGVRFEVQGDFLRNGIDQLGRMPFPASNKGTVRTYGLMANALYDMNIGVPWLYPYIGVGGGYQWTHLDGFNAVQAGGPFSVSSDDTRGKPAAQVIVGASMPISGVPGLSLTADYRFMKIWGGEKFNTTEIPVGGGAPVNTTLKLGNQYRPYLPVRRALRLQCPGSAAASDPRGSACAGACSVTLLHGVLRLGQGNADRPRPGDHQGGRRQLDPRAVHAHRGERLYRHVGHAAVQPGPVDTTCPGGGRGVGA